MATITDWISPTRIGASRVTSNDIVPDSPPPDHTTPQCAVVVTVYRPIASYTYPHSDDATFCPPLVLANDHALPFPHVTEPPSPISQTTSSTSAVKVTVMPASLFDADTGLARDAQHVLRLAADE